MAKQGWEQGESDLNKKLSLCVFWVNQKKCVTNALKRIFDEKFYPLENRQSHYKPQIFS